MLAFTGASHPRLGSRSPAHVLTHEVYNAVGDYVLPPRYIPSFHRFSDLFQQDLMQGTLPSEAVFSNLSDNRASVIELEISSLALQTVLWKGRMPMFSRETHAPHDGIRRDPDHQIPGYCLYIKEHAHTSPTPIDLPKFYDLILLFYHHPSEQSPVLKMETIVCTATMILEMMGGFRNKNFRFPGNYLDLAGNVVLRSSRMLHLGEDCTAQESKKCDLNFPAASLRLRVDPNQNFSLNTMLGGYSAPTFPF